MSIRDRFVGQEGRRLLVNALSMQAIISGNRSAAEAIAEVAVLEEYSPGAKIIEQGRGDNDIFFIVTGMTSALINNREINTRGAGQHVGAMAMIDPSAIRSATILSTQPTLVARISEPQFTRIADEHPKLWRALSIQLGERLRQRSKFISKANPQPHVFIGSSVESLKLATQIRAGLEGHPISVYLWTDDIFTASKTSIESLETELDRVDFAILVLGLDDKVFSRGKDADAPRDNVIFELGLFMGALTRARTFLVRPKDREIKMPTDLLGVTPLYYSSEPSDVTGEIQSLCASIRKLIGAAGPK
jgi:CRP/FNR family cyclic AMP-dependent transcriptional regulator